MLDTDSKPLSIFFGEQSFRQLFLSFHTYIFVHEKTYYFALYEGHGYADWERP